MPRVVADHHPETGSQPLFQNGTQPGGRGGHHGGVHPVAARPDPAAQAGRAENQRSGHRIGQFGPGGRIPTARPVDQRLQRGPVGRIRIAADPLGGRNDCLHLRLLPRRVPFA